MSIVFSKFRVRRVNGILFCSFFYTIAYFAFFNRIFFAALGKKSLDKNILKKKLEGKDFMKDYFLYGVISLTVAIVTTVSIIWEYF